MAAKLTEDSEKWPLMTEEAEKLLKSETRSGTILY